MVKGFITLKGCHFIRDKDVIAKLVDEGGSFEPFTTQWILNVLASRGGAFIDVGAYTGWIACLVAKAGYPVVAFEPHQAIANRLEENAKLNGLQFQVHRLAVSDTPGKATLLVKSGGYLSSSGSIDHSPKGSVQGSPVRTEPLDRMDLPTASVLKIDVEGNEMKVLAGGVDFIHLHRPHIVAEANTPQALIALQRWATEHRYTTKLADVRNLLMAPLELT